MSDDKEQKEKTDVEELRQVLDVVAERVPGLVRGLRDVLYSKEAAANMADAVATFYKKLVEAGIAKEDALDMARGYMINLRDVFQNVNPGSKKESEEDD
ncbi:MAG: hypothetical protein NUV94_00140 [Candidatus Acetothermia bacterium]|nr:hypothetical protein [Candidatus Acetothermia bacterium]